MKKYIELGKNLSPEVSESGLREYLPENPGLKAYTLLGYVRSQKNIAGWTYKNYYFADLSKESGEVNFVSPSGETGILFFEREMPTKTKQAITLGWLESHDSFENCPLTSPLIQKLVKVKL